MKKQPGSETTSLETVSVLSVSPMEEDHCSLQSIFGHSKWKLRKSHSIETALHCLHDQEIPVILCECDLAPGTWRDLVEHLGRLPYAPSVIVSSRIADERLWSEALNLGAWDVLAKPFKRTEVFCAVSAAWLHWRNRQQQEAAPLKVMRAC